MSTISKTLKCSKIFDNIMLDEMKSNYYEKKLDIYDNELYENILKSVLDVLEIVMMQKK